MRRRGTDGGVFVPAVMGAGLLFSVSVLAIDSLEHVLGRRSRASTGLAAVEVARHTRGVGPGAESAQDERRRRLILTVLAAACLGIAAYVAPGAWFNYLRPGGYLAEAAWILALSIGLAVTAGLLGIVFGVSAARPHTPVAPARRAWWAAEMWASRRPRGDVTHRAWGRRWHGTASVVMLCLGVAGGLWTLAVAVDAPFVQRLDDRLLDSVGRDNTTWGWAEVWGRTEVSAVLAALVVTVLGRRVGRLGVIHVGAVVAGLVANVSMKWVIDRPRPLDPVSSGAMASYPSGHMIQATLSSVFITAAVWRWTRRRGVTTVVAAISGMVALACGVSRVTEAAHWPSDVVGGALVAATVAAAGLLLLPGATVAARPTAVIMIPDTIATAAGRWARRLVAANVVVLAGLILTVGVPAAPEATLGIARLQQAVQFGLLILAVIAAVMSWWSLAGGAVIMAVSGTAMAWFAALEYSPVWALGIAVAFLTPAFGWWLAWQQGQSLRALVVMGVTAAVMMSAVWVGAATVHDRFFGPTHPTSDVALPAPRDVEWIWTGDLGAEHVTVVAALRHTPSSAHLVVTPIADPQGSFVVPVASRGADAAVVAAEVTGLEPGGEYRMALSVDGRLDDRRPVRIRTPLVGAQSFRVVFGSCARTASNGSVFDAMRALDPLLYINAGDAHYGDVADDDPDRLRAVWQRSLTAPAQQALYQQVPVAYVWDDHDYGGNDSDASSPARRMAHEVYREIVPHASLPHADDIAQSLVIGRIRFVLTDTRSHRRPATDGSGSLLGERQLAWLLGELRAARQAGQVTVWVSPTPWIGAPDPTSDTWAGFAEERRRLADALVAEGLDQLVMLSGDAHMVAIDDGTNSGYSTAGGRGFPVAHGSALDRPGSVKGGPYSEGAFPGGGQFGVLDIDDDGTTVEVTLSGRTWRGDVLVNHTVSFRPG